jgi:hypothetical protein
MEEDSWDAPEIDVLDRDADAGWRRDDPPPAVLAEMFRPFLPERVPDIVRAADAYAGSDPFERQVVMRARIGGMGTRMGETLAFFGVRDGRGPDRISLLAGEGHVQLSNALVEAMPDPGDVQWLAETGLWSCAFDERTSEPLRILMDLHGVRAAGELEEVLASEGPPYGPR